ncbi:hypothetical protein [Bacillus cereus]|uniref:hypothetical protein n=1 Tax=Bacillus cereus TaxID=1396 RepID=UPI000BFDC6A6|nr:hypothetical protein [Bacillus cereus]PGP39435.1 hypothetical protein CN989_02035 [Bacillus cereus]
MEHILNYLDAGQELRNAYSSIDGYFYQFDLTLLHLLQDATEKDLFDGKRTVQATFKIEKIEDYVKYYELGGKSHIRLAQIKHHNKHAGGSEYREAILYLYRHFLKYKSLKSNEIVFKAKIFHYDMSPENKEPLKILNEAIAKEEVKKGGKEKQSATYLEVSKLEVDISERAEFAQHCGFKKCDSLKDTTLKVKEILVNEYSSYKEEYAEADVIYAVAINKIIEAGRQGESLSIKVLENYLQRSDTKVSREYYEKSVIRIVFEATELHKERIEGLLNRRSFTPQKVVPKKVDVQEYCNIISSIQDFLCEKLKEPGIRRSFLNTIVPEKVSDYISNTKQEYDEYLKHSGSIKEVISKLSKIMYYYKKLLNEDAKLDEWFKIDDSVWLFTYPMEQRANGAIMGDLSSSTDTDTILGEISERLLQAKIKPSVWYLGIGHAANLGIVSSQPYPYKLDIMNVDEEMTPCEPGSDYFHIQCLQCLAAYNPFVIEGVPNIFTHKCIREGTNDAS